MIWIQPGFSWTWNWTFPSLGLFGGKASMFEIWTFPNTFLFFATLWGRKSSIPHNHTFNFFWGKFKFWSLDVPQLIVFHFWGGQVQVLKSGHLHFLGEKLIFQELSGQDLPQLHFSGKSSIPEVRTCHNCIFWGEKFNLWSMDVPQLIIAFFGGKIQFLKFGLATIAFFWGKSSISEVWTCHNW